MNTGARPAIAFFVAYDEEWFAAHPESRWQWRPRLPREFGLLEPHADHLHVVSMLIVRSGALIIRAGLGDGLIVASVYLDHGLPQIEKLIVATGIPFGRLLWLRHLSAREIAERSLPVRTPRTPLYHYEAVAMGQRPRLRRAAQAFSDLVAEVPGGGDLEAAFGSISALRRR